MLKIASKCYNRAHKHWHSRMEASFFIRGGGRRSAAPSPGPASAWLPSTGAGGGVGASLARAPLSPNHGAASSCSAGGGSIACVVLANLYSLADAPFSQLIRTLPRCALQVNEVLAGKFSISPYCRQNRRNLHLLWACDFITKLLAKDDDFAVSGLRRPATANSQHQQNIS